MSEQEYIVRYSISRSGKTERYDKVGELVRCKDCKWYVPSEYSVYGAGFCKAIGRLTYPKPDDFCSRGERMDEVEE